MIMPKLGQKGLPNSCARPILTYATQEITHVSCIYLSPIQWMMGLINNKK